MSQSPWEIFFREKIKKIFIDKESVVDIGGGLRVSKDKGNCFDENRAWIKPLIEKVDYKILDLVSDYNPDIIGDIHNLPFNDNSQEAIVCIAVLEHIHNPIKACQEIYRVLKPGGYCLLYVPFLYPYHPSPGYYGDYWRFTRETINMLFEDFSLLEKITVRGPSETLINLSPFGKIKFIAKTAYFVDKLFLKDKFHGTSGYNVFLIK